MNTNDPANVAGDEIGLEHLGDDLMRKLGGLDEAAAALSDGHDVGEIDPETVGQWITAIGKAILAIFKP